MKKRIACLLLTLVMILSLVPTAAITASAAPARYVSEAGIKVIKDYVGFHKNAYETYSGSGVYRIGYGTPGVKGQSITEANADKLLRDELVKVEAVVNAAMADAPDSALVQKRFDALVWYTYIEGSGWTGSSMFVSAVKGNVSNSDLVNAMCTWDMIATGYADNDSARAVLARRMAMANLYINGSYSAAATGSFAYTVFDAGEGAGFPSAARKMVQVFDTNVTTKIAVGEASSANKFLGWYLNNALVTGVGSATAGKTLVARWQGADVDKVPCSYTLPAYVIYEAAGVGANDFVIVRQQPAVSSTQVDIVKREATVSIVAEKIVGTEKWLELATGGWVKFSTTGSVLPTIVPSTTVTITDDYVNIRENPSVTAKKVGTAMRGETRTIVMTAEGGKWGYCSEGWIFLAYTTYNASASTSTPGAVTGSGTPGVVTGAASVNVRENAGVSNRIVTKLAEGTAITVYQQTTVDNASWGKIDQGWISMSYVKLSQSAGSQNAGSNATTGSTVYVSSSVSLNVRSGPDTGYTKIGSLNPGASVVILQKQVTGGVTWGLTDQGWINLNYVSTSAPSGSGSGSAAYGIGGTVVNCANGVNIRAAAGTTNALVGVQALGSRVTVSERVQVNGFYWGKIDRGWVCMDYIQLDSAWKDQVPTQADPSDNVVTTFEGYPAVTTAMTQVYETASSDAKVLMTLNSGAAVKILARSISGEKLFGKVTIGNTTGWINMADVLLQPVNAKVTAARADAYELPNTRSKFYASLVQGTYVTVGNADGTGWQLSDGVLWGQTKVTVGGVDYVSWIKMNDVTMFKENTLPTGVTTLNGAGYLTGTVNADSLIFKDSNGNVTTEATDYTLVPGHRVNILARNYIASTGATWAKVTVGAVTGWFQMTSSNVTLDHVTVQATTQINAWSGAAPASANVATNAVIPAGSKLTIVSRQIIPNPNEMNHGITDIGQVFVGDNHDTYYWVALDDGRLTYVSAASNAQTSTPNVQSGVVITGTAPAGLSVREEAVPGSRELLKVNSSANITILNWKNVGGITWGKVQIGNIVGWVNVAEVDFSTLKGTVAVTDLYVYAAADKYSSVQILRVNDREISFLAAPVFDGTTVWAQIRVADKTGWVDLASLRLNTPGAVYAPELVIATGKINSVDATINISGSGVSNLPKGTAVNLTKVKMDAGEAWWLIDLGENDGWVKMDCLNMNSSVARITTASADIYDDLVTASMPGAKVLYTLYRDETVTVLNYKTMGGALYGEVAYGTTTGWIQICDAANVMKVTLTPGSTGTTLGGNTAGSNANTNTNTNTNTNPGTNGTTNNENMNTYAAAHIVCSTTVNVRSGAGVEYNVVTTLANGTNVKVYEKATSSLGTSWAHIDQGWVSMEYVQMGAFAGTANTPAGSTALTTPSIMTSVPAGAIAVGFCNQNVDIYAGHGLGYNKVGSVAKNNSLVIYEKILDGGMSWGRTDKGWVCISYLTITGIGTAPNATVSGNQTVNVRGSASSAGALMAKVLTSSRVTVYENAGGWYRTDMGWISSDYIVTDAVMNATLSNAGYSTPTTNATTITDSGLTEVG